jgi:thiol-disulfide isomerase/thioredoxin
MVLALMLAAAGVVCLAMSSRFPAALLFAGAVVFLILPGDEAAVGTYDNDYFSAQFRPKAEAEPAPAARFRDEAGNSLTLADFRGQVVLLNVWATWCEPCRAEMASLDRLQALLRDDGLRVVAVSVDRNGADKVREFYRGRGLKNLALYLDQERRTRSAFGVRGIPVTYLIDREGNLVGSLIGAADWDSRGARALVARYLDE